MQWLESFIEYTKKNKRVYVVVRIDEEQERYSSASEANADFPGAFDEEDDE